METLIFVEGWNREGMEDDGVRGRNTLHLWSEWCGASEGGGERVVLSEWTHGYPLNFTPTMCPLTSLALSSQVLLASFTPGFFAGGELRTGGFLRASPFDVFNFPELPPLFPRRPASPIIDLRACTLQLCFRDKDLIDTS